MKKAFTKKFECECECGFECSSRDWQSFQLTASKHGCRGKTGISITCKCEQVFQTRIRDLPNFKEDHEDCEFIPPPVPPVLVDNKTLPIPRVPSEDSMDVVDSLTGCPCIWICYQPECKTKTLKNYRTFRSLKNWTAHMQKEHAANLVYSDYIDVFKPVDEVDKSIISEFGNLSIGKKA
jgi:hypothetical protein